MKINNYDYTCSTPAFTANLWQYRKAVNYLRRERRIGRHSVIKAELDIIKDGIKEHYPLKFMRAWLDLNPAHLRFSYSDKANDLRRYGIKALDIDRLEGIQYGIDVFKDLSMREIAFLAYRTMNFAVKRGCANMCEHCFQNAIPASKLELSEMPFEDFKKIMDGFGTINKRINKFLRTKWKSALVGNKYNVNKSGANAQLGAFFYDSDGINIIAKDISGKEHDFIELTEAMYNATGKRGIFDTSGWNTKNKKLQQRAERYAEYFSQPGIEKKVEQLNLSVNTFNPLYTKAYKLGYRPGMENDLTNPSIQKGKILYDRYIEKISNMLATLGLSDNAYLLMTYSIKYERNMDGMYFSDLKLIMDDVEKRCCELLKEKYSSEEYIKKSQKIHNLIHRSLEREENVFYTTPRCSYEGRYKDLFNSRNPDAPRDGVKYTEKISDINALSSDEYKNFLDRYLAIVDTNGQIYYLQHESSLRKLGKELKISTNGKETPRIHNLEVRD